MKKIYLILIFALILILSGVLFWRYYIFLDPNSPRTYYKIFDKTEILAGNESTGIEVDAKLDKRLEQYKRTFEQLADTNDSYKLRALFYMNFVHFYGHYGLRNIKEKSLKEILWGDEHFHCGTNTTLLAMLLEKAGIESRTVSINNGAHGFVEVKFDGQWNVLDPTANLWFKASIEEIKANGTSGISIKQFFMAAEDESNTQAREHMTIKEIECDLFCLKRQMLAAGSKEFPITIDKYNYINLAEYQY